MLSPIVNRREALKQAGCGFGMLGLAGLMAQEGLLSHAPAAVPAGLGNRSLNPLAPVKPHFDARATRVVWIFANGGPSQVDTWDYKPALEKWDGKSIKEFDPNFSAPDLDADEKINAALAAAREESDKRIKALEEKLAKDDDERRTNELTSRFESGRQRLRDAGYQAGAKVLQQGMTNRHDADVRDQLRERAVWQLKRLRLADNTPIAIEHAFYPPDIGLELEKRDLISIIMYRVFEEELGHAIKEARQTIGASLADASSARLLGVKAGSPLLAIQRLTIRSVLIP